MFGLLLKKLGNFFQIIWSPWTGLYELWATQLNPNWTKSFYRQKEFSVEGEKLWWWNRLGHGLASSVDFFHLNHKKIIKYNKIWNCASGMVPRHSSLVTFSWRHTVEWGSVKGHSTEWYLAEWHWAEWHWAEWHWAEWYWAEWYWAEWHSAQRH